MKKYLQEKIIDKKRFFVLFTVCLMQFVLFSHVNAQISSVNGTVTAAPRYLVQNASVTFIDISDTTKKYSALTDASGNYNISFTAIESNKISLPTKFQLGQNYPNPFSGSTSIPYQLNQQTDVKVIIYDILGRVVRKFTVGAQQAGSHAIQWNGLNNFGEKLANGVYLYQLQAGDEKQVKKMVLNNDSKSGFGLNTQINLSVSPNINQISNATLSGGTYTVRITNTSTTSPVVVPQTFTNQAVQGSTTINFTVNYIPKTTVDLNNLHQIIRGFGASNIILWRPDMTDSEITTAFGTGTGQLGFSILRIMVENDSTRWNLSLATAKKAQGMGAIVIASPWYAPTNMVETVNYVSRVRHDMYAAYANHLNSFIKYMTKNGVSIYGLSIQNEPDTPTPTPTNNSWTGWTANEIFTFMHNNANAITGTKVMAPESFHFDRSYSDPILNDSIACANTNIICGHIYGGGLASYPLAQQKGKEVWMTEYLINSPGSGANMDTSWTAALATASSINSSMNSNMSAYVWWYIVRYYGPIGDGTAGFGQAEGVVTRKGYVMSQFARFIRPGYYRIDSNISPAISSGMDVSAYKDPATSKVIVVAYNTNTGSKDIIFQIQNGSQITRFTPYTTSATKNCVQGNNINVVNGNFTVTLEASSITTFVSN